MANFIQIKRSNNNPTPANTLNSGELAYSYIANTLYIGAQTGTSNAGFIVGGSGYAYLDRTISNTENIGKLIANAVIVVDANGFISNTRTSALAISTSTGTITSPIITVISNTANSTAIGGGETLATTLVTAAAIDLFVKARAAAAPGSNTQISYNNSGNTDGSANFTFNNSTDTLTVNNITIGTNTSISVLIANGTIGSDQQVLHSNGSTVYWATPDLGIGSTNTEITFNDSDFANGSASFTFNKTSNTVTMAVANITSNAIIKSIIANGSIGQAGYALFSDGANVYWASASAVAGSNTQIQFNDSGTMGSTSNLTFDKTTGAISVGNSSVNTVINSSSVSVNAIFATGTVNAASLKVGSDFIANVTAAYANAIFVTNLVNSASFTVGSNFIANTTAIISTGFANVTTSVNSALLTVGSDFIANTTGAYHTGTMNAASLTVGSQFSANATAAYANAIFVTNLVNAASFTVGSNFIANTTHTTFTGANVDMASAYLRVQDVEVSGNLKVTGTLTTIDTTSLVVKDANIKVANGNVSTDTIDFGIYGQSGNATTTYYSGLFRDHTAGSLTRGTWSLFSSNVEPTTTVDTAATGYSLATLRAFLDTGAFVSNSSAVQITANSTVSVSLTANSISLATALVATSGGTGYASYANGDIVYASNTTYLSKLAIPASNAPGQVLQINDSGMPSYGTLDGGTF